jgi:prolipoprotein diacylglyceryltransferase
LLRRGHGQTTGRGVLAGYALLRFATEVVRADDCGVYAGLSTSQWVGLLVLAAVAVLWRSLKRRAERTFPAPSA